VIDRARRRSLEQLLGDRVRFEVPLRRLTSLRIGGPAEALAEPASREELASLLAWCAAERIPHRVLGAGFNTLVLDGGMEGVVIRLTAFRRLEQRPGSRVRAEAGVSHAQVQRFCLERGLSGLEFAAGIPGTVGGWIAMNAGVPEREVQAALLEVEVMSPSGARRRHFERRALRFDYRALRGLAPGSVVVAALFGLEPADRADIRARVEGTLVRRRATQPLDVPSCGSVFKNPPGDFAGRLIELAGLKGEREGGAQISCVHANFIVNQGGATARDVLALIRRARRAVFARTGIRLATEVRIVGRER
jgi:UDP-N-acetylmuramate dehydrogenase